MMKARYLLLACALGTSLCAQEYEIVSRGPHERTWEKVIQRMEMGRLVPEVHRYVEIQTGMHYWNDASLQWTESQEIIEALPDGTAVGRQGQNRVIFLPNINSEGAVELFGPDGVHLRFAPLALAYFDAVTGRSAVLAITKDCVGEILPQNYVIYRDAFEGSGIIADVLYSYRKSGIEQDIVLRTQPVEPELAAGLAGEDIYLQVISEFIQPEDPVRTARRLDGIEDPALRAQMVQPDFMDEDLAFGQTTVIEGRAFWQNQVPGSRDPATWEQGAAVGKSWKPRSDGKALLYESVRYSEILPKLQDLPQADGAALLKNQFPRMANWQDGDQVPKRVSKLSGQSGRIQIAAGPQTAKAGYVLDFQTINTSQSNYTFRGDLTYYVTGDCTLSGTTVLEPNTVIKYDRYTNNYYPRLTIGTLDCRTGPHKPAIFTAKDDDTVGEIITGSTGNPGTNRYAYSAIYFNNAGGSFTAEHLRIGYARRAFTVQSPSCTIRHVQVGKVDSVIYSRSSVVDFQNVLMTDVAGIALEPYHSSITNRCVNVTFNAVTNLNGSVGTYVLTNCLLVAVGTTNTYSGAFNAAAASASSVFEAVGAGKHYLPSGSTHRNAGSSSISAQLLADFKKLTTDSPQVNSNAYITVDTTIVPRAMRDTDAIDRGYHYDPLDYVYSWMAIQDCTLTINPGTAIGVFGGSGLYGFALQSGAKIEAIGRPDNLISFIRYNAAQEPWSSELSTNSTGATILSPWSTVSVAPSSVIRFVQFALLGGAGTHLQDYGNSAATHEFSHCEIYGGIVGSGSGGGFWSNGPLLNVTNSLLHRVFMTLTDETAAGTPTFWNNTFYRGGLVLSRLDTGDWTFKDGFLDQTTNLQPAVLVHNYNGYQTNYQRLTNAAANDVILASAMAFETIYGGRFYQPSGSALINAGSRNATNAGFYHFTVLTNQTKEAASTVDIGFHFVSATNGSPSDVDGDGLPDYLEDKNGNGVYDSGSETDWTNSNNGLTSSAALLLFTPLK